MGDEVSVRTVVQRPPGSFRWIRTLCVARSGSASTRTSIVPNTLAPSAGVLMVSFGAGTTARFTLLSRLCPALSRTTAR